MFLHVSFKVGFFPARKLADLALVSFIVQMNGVDVVSEVMALRHSNWAVWALCFLDS